RLKKAVGLAKKVRRVLAAEAAQAGLLAGPAEVVSRAKARAAQAASRLKKAVGLAKKVRRVLAAEAAQAGLLAGPAEVVSRAKARAAQARLVLAKEF
ncbi:MAG: hypothetical protein LM600_03715, partial [Thaumarchaeota archaeon]|nr:hypothetical protein [Nitrososphaerota archaeon]